MLGQDIFKFQKTNFREEISIKDEIPVDLLLYEHLDYFDRDGYELTVLERSIHNHFEIPLGYCLNHVSVCERWVHQTNKCSVALDHSLISHRFSYEGNARKQIEELCKKRPELRKLLAIKPKWGIDFSVDFIDPQNCFELVHIEHDSYKYEEIHTAASKLSSLIMNTDFKQLASVLIDEKHKWESLNSDDQSDYKAKKFGFKRAFNNQKAISGRLVSQ
jgi:hypothetical protein